MSLRPQNGRPRQASRGAARSCDIISAPKHDPLPLPLPSGNTCGPHSVPFRKCPRSAPARFLCALPPASFLFPKTGGSARPFRTPPRHSRSTPTAPAPANTETKAIAFSLALLPFPSPWPFSLSLPPSLPPMARAVPYSSRSAATPPCRPAPFLRRGEDIRLGDGMHQSLCGLHGCGWPAGSTVLHSTGARHRAAYCDACAYPVARGASAGVRYASVRLWPLTCAYPFSARGHGLYKRVLASRRNRDVSCSYRILLLCAFACFITSPHCIALCRLTTN